MNKIGIIIEARMNSSRLPGKVLKKINNVPILYFMINRLKLIKNIDNIIIATTKSKKDDGICNLAVKNNIDFYRGSENNVMQRVIKAAEFYNLKHIVEITGDDPLVDPKISSFVVSKYIKNNKYNTVCANDFYSQVPLGFYTRVFSLKTLKKVYKNSSLFNKEHVESYFYQNSYKFNFVHTHISLKDKKNHDVRLTLDTKEDFLLIKHVINNFKKRIDFSFYEIIEFLNKNPHLKKINKKINQNAIR